MRSELQNVLLIGVDGGATEVKAHAVAWHPDGERGVFRLRPESAARVYERLEHFEPVPVDEQLRQRDAGRLERSEAECEQARMWVSAAAEATADVARQAGAGKLLVGIGMPGLKTPDRRGILVINNGPRIPDFLDAYTDALHTRGLELAAPVAALGSDADYCGLGEEYAEEGLFRDVTNAYYVGGGTGLADALKLRGRLVPFDDVQPWMLKSWQIPSALGPTFERLVSAASLNRIYANWRRTTSPETGEPTSPPYPETAAASGDPAAQACLAAAALVLAELVYERLSTLYQGRAEAPHRGPAYAALEKAHPYLGTLLDRVIIGQRLGLIYADPAFREVFAEPFERYLATFVADSGVAALRSAYLEQDAETNDADPGRGAGTAPLPTLRPGFVRASRLRAAPALGAAVAAVQAATRG